VSEVSNEDTANLSSIKKVGDCIFEIPYVSLSNKAKAMFRVLINDELTEFMIPLAFENMKGGYRRLTLNGCSILIEQEKLIKMPKIIRDHLVECFRTRREGEETNSHLRVGSHYRANDPAYSKIF
jgi:hypothetical protein